MFDSFESWQSHEMDRHRRQWACQLCGVACEDNADTRAHLIRFHGDIVREEQIDIILQASSTAVEHLTAKDCPFCPLNVALRKRNLLPADKEPVLPCKKFMKHLGRHLEEFTLLVFPRSEPHGDKSNKGTEITALYANFGVYTGPLSALSSSILPIAETSDVHTVDSSRPAASQPVEFAGEPLW